MLNMFSRITCAILLMFANFALAAESSESRLNLEQTKSSNQPPGQDVDQLITNKKLRAETGSKSQYSIATGFGYSGGSLEKPLSVHRPNIAEGTGATDVANAGASISGKYAITSTKAILAGTGVRWMTPLQDTPSDYTGDKVDVDNPYLIYQYLYKWLGVQSSAQAQVTYFTATNLVRDGYVSTFGLSQNNVYAIPETRLSLGVFAYTGLGYFDKDTAQAKANQSDYSVGVLPFLEYQISDRLNIRTQSNLGVYQHIRNQPDAWTFQQQKVTQNIGLGISITRDFYLSPGIDFLIGDIRSNRTTVSLGGNLNLF
jgi:hypothetical protein